jgi:hypothetical protein
VRFPANRVLALVVVGSRDDVRALPHVHEQGNLSPEALVALLADFPFDDSHPAITRWGALSGSPSG